MKTIFKTMLMLLVLTVSLAAAACASTDSGKVTSVDTDFQTINVETADGTQMFGYTAETLWPEGVSDPSSLVDADVEVVLDSETGEILELSRKS